LGPVIGAKAQRPAPAVQKGAREPEKAAGQAAGQAAGGTAGGKERAAAPAPAAVAGPHMLPDIPFNTERWNSVDADVTLRAKTIVRAKESPLENLVTHLKMKDSLLTLDPLDFGLAGGHLKAVISLDGRQDPIQARAKISARKILLAKLFPTVNLAKTSIGQINGEFDLAGKGNSVGRMLATSDGRIGLIVANGEISKLLMEEIGLHLLEILQLKITGDQTIKLRCAVADFGVKSGVMQANALVLDTEVSTIVGSGSIDLGQEKLDLTLVPKTRYTSPVALRGPIYVRGTFSKPEVDLDKGRIALRSAGALALGLINPLLALIPLVEMGPGVESECARLMHEAQAPLPNAPGASATGSAK
jgi:AsmA protein